jgi:hypothetical protein
MNRKLNILKKIVSTVVIICLVLISIYSFVIGTGIDAYYIFNIVICLLVSFISVKDSWGNTEQKTEFDNIKISWIYFLLFVGIFLSIVEIFMFYEETVLDRGSIASAIGAVAAYTIFDSVHKYLYGKA